MDPTEAVTSAVLNGTSVLSTRLAGSGAYKLFHMPLARSRVRTAERELFDRAETGHVEVGGRRSVTYRWGDGTRPVLLVHGWQSRASRLSDFVPGLLDRGHSVVAFDAPGHGDSSGRDATILDYRTVITTLHDEFGPFDALVAHSLGALASFYALKHGVKAQRIVTISGVCDFDYLVDEYCSALRLRPRLKTELHRRIARELFPGTPPERTPFSATHATEDVHAPMLVIHDEDDSRIEVAQGRRLAAAFAGRARLVTTNGLGHRRILGDPEVVRTVLDFVADADRVRARQEPRQP
ncbi:alpha/beta fold hydrolase [Streptomyces sp. NPDC015220]|uniref:alpha/beta fold hydrolase n=1 Tax=Streptomyces sp. NPDC015220 TaxID=3364947 RepID=UPI0036FA7EF7